MKKIILTLAIAFASVSLSAKDVVKNSSTGAILNETAGTYSVRGWSTGALILGDSKEAIKTLTALDACFAKEGVGKVLNKELQKDYEVYQGKDGWYVVCIKAGGAKLYASDVNLFLATLTGRSVVKGIGKAGEWVSKKADELIK